MKDFRSIRLLDSVVSLTSDSNRQRFRGSFIRTVRELLRIDEVSFLRPQQGVAGEFAFQVLHHEDGRLRYSGAGRSEAEAGPELRQDQMASILRLGHCLEVDEFGTVLLLPVFVRDALVEVVRLRASTVSREELGMLRGFVRLYRNFIALIAEGERDPLTGLLNRRVLETRLEDVAREHANHHMGGRGSHLPDRRHEGEGLKHFIAVLDIDRFKRINDSLGHLFGDEVILLVSQIMREVFRDEDMIFRYGGEEFVVIVTTEDEHGAMAALQRCRERVAAHRFPQLGQVTISAGVAQLHAHELPQAVIARADQALYCAKEDGRNRAYAFEDLRASGRVSTEEQNYEAEIF